MPFVKRYENVPKIIELECRDDGIVGHQIRNMALNIINYGYIYFLDDDTVLHPHFWNIINNDFKSEVVIYTFNLLYQNGSVLRGHNPSLRNIDMAQIIFSKKIVKDLRFDVNNYCGDGIFIETLYEQNKDNAQFINSVAAYYNWLNKDQPLPRP
jgi:hypothetical protein